MSIDGRADPEGDGGQWRALGSALWMSAAVVIAVATLTPSSQTVNSMPWCLVCGEIGGVDVFLNVLLFVPLGIGLSMAGVRPSRAIVRMCLYTLLIESLQFSIIAGRDASISDILTNSLGGLIGFAMGTRMPRWLLPDPRLATRLVYVWLIMWFIALAAGSYALRPAPTASRYYGQITRSLGHPRYPGVVLDATIGGVSVPNTAFTDSRTPRGLLSQPDGADIDITVVPISSTTWFAPIVRIADSSQREVLVVGANRGSLLFSMRTRGTQAKLRPLLFRLFDVFRIGANRDHPFGDTLHIRVRYGARAVTMRAENHGRVREASIRLTPARAWRYLSPLSQFTDNSRRAVALDLLLYALAVVPLGYWFAFAAGDVRPFAGIAVAGGTAAGVFGIPFAFGFGAPSAMEVIAVIAGTGVGCALGIAVRPLRH